MIYTTYFANLRHLPTTVTPIAICGDVPKFYTGLTYKKLAPKYSFWSVWEKTKDNDYYIENFNKLVLDNLNQEDVVSDLLSLSPTEDIALVCYEKPKDFCHRHLVADWLCRAGYNCKEFDGVEK